jgi:hypothetical protein
MTKEEARNVFGGSIVNNLLSLGAEPTNVVRQDGLIEWKSDGYIEVGGVQVWAYYYFEDGEDVDRCDRKLIKSAMDSGFRGMSAVLSYANCMAGNKPVNHIRVSNDSRGWCGSYTLYGKEID